MKIAAKFMTRSVLAFAAASLAGFIPAGAVLAQTAASAKAQADAAARKQIADAQAQVNTIKSDQKRIKDKLTAEFESKEEWKNTASNHKKAKTAYETAQKAAKRTLLAKPEYKKLVAEREAAIKKNDELSTQRNASPDAIAKAGTDLAAKTTALRKMEAEVVANDEKVQAAKEEFDKADKEMKALDEEVTGALQSDPEYVAIAQQLEQAEAQVKQLRDQQAAARKAARPTATPRRTTGRGEFDEP